MVTSWTDEGASSPSARVAAQITAIKAVHVNELRTALIAERSRRGWGAYSWPTGLPATANATDVLKTHLDALRDASNITGCATDTPYAPYPGPYTAYTGTIDVNGDIKTFHINELRVRLNQLENVACLCHCNGQCTCNGQACGDNSARRFKKNIKLWA